MLTKIDYPQTLCLMCNHIYYFFPVQWHITEFIFNLDLCWCLQLEIISISRLGQEKVRVGRKLRIHLVQSPILSLNSSTRPLLLHECAPVCGKDKEHRAQSRE